MCRDWPLSDPSEKFLKKVSKQEILLWADPCAVANRHCPKPVSGFLPTEQDKGSGKAQQAEAGNGAVIADACNDIGDGQGHP